MSGAFDQVRIEGRRVDPAALTHAEKDRMGHFANRLREEEYLARRRSRWSWYGQRFADLMKVLRARVGPRAKVPEGVDDAQAIIRCFAYHFQARPDVEDLAQRLTEWCMEHCENWTRGWPDKGDIIRFVLSDIRGRRQDLGARVLARELHVTWAERCRLGLRTIGAFDLTPGEFRKRVADRKREVDRERVITKRRQKGMRSWEERSRLSREQPWKALGISRATYYRRLKQAKSSRAHNETVVSRLGEASNTCDTTVSRRIVGETVQKDRPAPVGRGTPVSPFSPGLNSTGTATVRLEDTEPYDALRPLGVATSPSHERRPSHGRAA